MGKEAAAFTVKGLVGRSLQGIARNILAQSIIKPITTAISVIFMWTFHSIMKLSGETGRRIMDGIIKTYYTPPSETMQWISSYIEQMTGRPFPKELLEKLDVAAIGDQAMQDFSRAIMDRLLAIIVPKGPITPEDGLNAAAGYLSINMQFQMSAWLMHLLGDVASFGMFKSLKDLPNAISWSFGLGWLSWLVMGTPFQESICTPLRWAFKAQLRSERITGTKIHDAYRSGYINSEEWNRLLEYEGWRNEDKVVGYYLSEKDYSDPMLRDGLFYGFFTEKDVIRELKKKNYSEQRAKNIINYWRFDRKVDILKDFYKETEDLYVDNKLRATDLRRAAGTLGFDTDEINMLVNIADMKKIKARVMTKADWLGAWRAGVIGIAALRTGLLNMGYEDRDVDIIVRTQTKKAPPEVVPEEIPEVKVLTKSELERAYKEGVISENDYRRGLIMLGYTEADATIVIRTTQESMRVEEEEEEVQEVIEREEKIRSLSKAELRTAYLDGIIGMAQLRAGLRDLAYSDQAIEVIVAGIEKERMEREIVVMPIEKELSKAENQRLYLEGVIDIEEMRGRILDLGYSVIATDLSTEYVEKQWLEREDKELGDEVKALRFELEEMYIEGRINRDYFQTQLSDLGYTAEAVRIITKYLRQRY